MNTYLVLHYGFKMPTPAEMELWNQWFASLGEHMVGMNGLSDGREITSAGTKELPFGEDSLTGYTLITAASLGDAEKIVQKCPIVASNRVYEIRPH